MPDRDSKVHIARNGSLLGAYELEHLSDMIERGQLLQSDQYFDEERGDWLTLADRPGQRANKEFKEFRAARERPATEESKGGSRRGGGRFARSKKNNPTMVFGWVASLFALCIAAGVWAYASVLQDRIKILEGRVADSEKLEVSLRRELQMLGELTPAGRVRAVITYEPSPNQVAIMSGATVGLYRRADVEEALRTVAKLGPASSPEEFELGAAALRDAIPSPVAVTLTDSNGRVDLTVPEDGEYVLVASAGKTVSGGTERMLWMVGFHAASEPGSLIVLGEKNAITMGRPNLRILDRTSPASAAASAP
jgi:hypothetical protein